jgi:peptidoglycan/LPS O-acetylase OafA/YrhL
MQDATGNAGAHVYRPDVDGLRAIAILSVVFYHAGAPWIPGGFTGVDIFFVISGYLIGGHIYDDLARGTFRYLNFYQRRAKRILPALYGVLVSLLVMGFFLFSPHEFYLLGGYALATVAFSSNILFWMKDNYFNPSSANNPLLMTWSLGVEEQFYIVIPLLMVLLSRLRQRMVVPLIGLVTAVSFALSWYTLALHPNADFYLLDTRAWELAVGVVLAILEARAQHLPLHVPGLVSNALGLAGAGLILASFWMVNYSTPFPGPAALPAVIGSALLLATSGSWINGILLSFAPMVFIGRISYSWYLWHWPLLAVWGLFYGGPLPLRWGLITVAVSFGLSVLSYYIVERPFRSSKRAAAPLLMRYATVSLILLAATSLICIFHGFAGRFPAVASIESVRQGLISDSCMVQAGSSMPNLAPKCVGKTASRDKFVVWGDSHALALAPALRIRATQRGYDFAEYAKGFCLPLIGATRYDPRSPQLSRECIAYNDVVLQRLISDSSVRVVALQGSWGSSFNPKNSTIQLVAEDGTPLPVQDQERSLQILNAALRKTLQSLRDADKQVVVFGDAPFYTLDPQWRMSTDRIPPRKMLVHALGWGSDQVDPGSVQVGDSTPPQQQARENLMRTALSVPGVTYWNLRSPLCASDDFCFYRWGETPYYMDSGHLSPQGALKALQGWQVPAPNP